MTELGKMLLILGGALAAIGAVLLLAGKFNLPLGHLPGDLVYRGKNVVFYFPLATCVIVSLVLSLILWLVNRTHR